MSHAATSAAVAVAGVPVAGAHPGSAELHGATRCTLRRCGRRAGALPRGHFTLCQEGTLTMLPRGHFDHAAKGGHFDHAAKGGTLTHAELPLQSARTLFGGGVRREEAGFGCVAAR